MDIGEFGGFWVDRPKSGFGLNVLMGVRMMQCASKSLFVTLSLQRCDIAHLPPVGDGVW